MFLLAVCPDEAKLANFSCWSCLVPLRSIKRTVFVGTVGLSYLAFLVCPIETIVFLVGPDDPVEAKLLTFLVGPLSRLGVFSL